MTLQEDLRRAAEQAPLAGFGVGEVHARVRSIRRRRRAVSAGAAACVAAALALGLVLTRPGGSGPVNPTPATQTPSPSLRVPPSITIAVDLTPTESNTTGAAVTVPIWMDGELSDGRGSMRTGYRMAHAVHAPDGSWYGMSMGIWWHWTSGGALLSKDEAASDTVGITPDGRSWAVLLKAGADVRLVEYGEHAQTWTAGPAASLGTGSGVVGILSGGDVVFNTTPSHAWFAHAIDGTVTRLPGNLEGALAVTPRGEILARKPGHDGDGICYSVVNEDGIEKGSGCLDPSDLVGFSGDGLLWAGSGTPGGDGASNTISLGPNPVSGDAGRLAASPDAGRLAEFTFPQGSVSDLDDSAWVGDSLVVPVFYNGTWQLLWLSQGGYRITRSVATPGGPDVSPYLLGAGPLVTKSP